MKIKQIVFNSILIGELVAILNKTAKKASGWDRLGANDKWAVIMAITGLVFGLLNYVTWWREETDSLTGQSRSQTTLIIIQIFFQIYLIVAACWSLEVFR